MPSPSPSPREHALALARARAIARARALAHALTLALAHGREQGEEQHELQQRSGRVRPRCVQPGPQLVARAGGEQAVPG